MKHIRKSDVLADGYKKCSSCKEIKYKTKFHKKKTASMGLSHICKECQKEYDRVRRFKLSSTDWSKCRYCGDDFKKTRKDKKCCSRSCAKCWSEKKAPRENKAVVKWSLEDDMMILFRIKLVGSVEKAKEMFFPNRTVCAVRKRATVIRNREKEK